MKRTKLLLTVVASLLVFALPVKAQTGGLATGQEGVRSTLPYPRATKAIPAQAMEYDSIAGCFVVRDTIVGAQRAGSRSGATATVVTQAASAYTEDGVIYG